MSICDSHEFHRLGFFSPRSSACPLFSQHSPETTIFPRNQHIQTWCQMGVELNQRDVFALMGPATTVTTGGRLCSRRSIKARLLILQNHVYGAKDHPRIIQGSSSCPNMEKTAGRRRAMWGHKNFTQLLKLLGPYGYRCSEGVETPRLCNSHTKIFVWSFSKIFHVFHDFWWLFFQLQSIASDLTVFFYELQILDPWQPRFRLAVKRNHMAKATSFSVLPIFPQIWWLAKTSKTVDSTF